MNDRTASTTPLPAPEDDDLIVFGDGPAPPAFSPPPEPADPDGTTPREMGPAQSFAVTSGEENSAPGTPRCFYQYEESGQCPYQPIHKCARCGGLICLEHTKELTSPSTNPRFAQFEGYYCPSCYDEVVREYNAEVDAYNQELEQEKKSEQRKQAVGVTLGVLGGACACLGSICDDSLT